MEIIAILTLIWIFLLYWIPKLLGYKKIGIILSSIGVLIVIVILFFIFDDDVFSKKDARNLLKEQNIILMDEFEIKENRSELLIDFYHTFTLKISSRDRDSIITEIKNSGNFKIGKKIFQSSETNEYIVREMFERHDNGYVPTHSMVEIDKKNNLLIFQDFDQ